MKYMDSKKILPLDGGIINDPELARIIQEKLKLNAWEFSNKSEELSFDQHFKPKGALAFFALLVLLGMMIWFGIYILMLSRV